MCNEFGSHWKKRGFRIVIMRYVSPSVGDPSHDDHQVNPYKKEKEFLAINPLGLVPVYDAVIDIQMTNEA